MHFNSSDFIHPDYVTLSIALMVISAIAFASRRRVKNRFVGGALKVIGLSVTIDIPLLWEAIGVGDPDVTNGLGKYKSWLIIFAIAYAVMVLIAFGIIRPKSHSHH